MSNIISSVRLMLQDADPGVRRSDGKGYLILFSCDICETWVSYGNQEETICANSLGMPSSWVYKLTPRGMPRQQPLRRHK